ncbi:MAG TPA: hypothetical protein VHE30_27685 [Polyangiaceae bacterium]|nr:hypothetical protein [Polyangiaceae bacterium]
MTALLAVGTAVGCSSSDKGTSPGNQNGSDSGTGGSAGSSTGGKGGASGSGTGGEATGGKGGSGGTKDGGTGGTSAEASTDGGGGSGECLGDVAPPTPDAGSEGFYDPCAVLPYYADYCYADSGFEGGPLAVFMCSAAQSTLRPAVAAALPACLAAITESPCSQAGRDKALACFDQVSARACDKPKLDGGTDPCASITNCGAITPAKCRDALRAFTDETIDGAIVPCLQLLAPDAGSEIGCDAAFLACLPARSGF